MVAIRFGKLAVKVDGSAEMPPLLLCQRFRGTMEDWDPGSISGLRLVARLSASLAAMFVGGPAHSNLDCVRERLSRFALHLTKLAIRNRRGQSIRHLNSF
jgi:hypothetical protein